MKTKLALLLSLLLAFSLIADGIEARADFDDDPEVETSSMDVRCDRVLWERLQIRRFTRFALLATVCLVATDGSRGLGARPFTQVNAALFSDLRWRCIGPFDGGPVSSVIGEAGVPGVEPGLVDGEDAVSVG